jgi:rhodanese-related sulfurtransferase
MSPRGGAGEVREVDPATARDMAARGALLLDVREPEEWARARIAGSVHVPLGDLDPSAIDPGTTVVAVCRSGNRSGRAAVTLAAAGHDVVNMAGGLTAWSRDGMPLESGPAAR